MFVMVSKIHIGYCSHITICGKIFEYKSIFQCLFVEGNDIFVYCDCHA